MLNPQAYTSGRLAAPWLASAALGLLRIVVAYMFILHGTSKLFGVPHVAMFDGLHLLSLEGLASVLETFGGIAILLGFYVRAIAFVFSGEMAVAYFMAHAARGAVFLPLLNAGEPAVLYCFIFLLFAASGGGAWCLQDHLPGGTFRAKQETGPVRIGSLAPPIVTAPQEPATIGNRFGQHHG